MADSVVVATATGATAAAARAAVATAAAVPEARTAVEGSARARLEEEIPEGAWVEIKAVETMVVETT